MILSRLPVAQVLRVQLPWPADPARSQHAADAARGRASQAPFGPLRVMTTHLEYYSHGAARGAGRGAARAPRRGVRARPRRPRPQRLRRSVPGPAADASRRSSPATSTCAPTIRCTRGMTAPFDDAARAAFCDAWQLLHPGEGAAADDRRPRLRPVARSVRVRLHLRDQRPVPAPAQRRGRRDDGGERPPAGARRARASGGRVVCRRPR